MNWLGIAVGVGTVAVFLLIQRLFPRRRSTVPGMKPSSTRNGNLNDMSKAGSLHQFLVDLHKKFGPIASFWYGTRYTVSIASPELFKQHLQIFDRPVEFFSIFEPLITRHSIELTNGSDGRARRSAFDKVFSYNALGIYYDKVQKVADEIVSKWDSATPDDHFPLKEHTFLFTLKGALIALLGDTFTDDKKALTYKQSYEVAFAEMEQRHVDPILPEENSTRAQNFRNALATLKEMVSLAVKEREDHGAERRDFLLIDAIIDLHKDEETRFADAITYIVGGFHSTSSVLAWCIYFLCLHQDVQEKLYEEINNVLGPKELLSHQSIGKLKYQRQVLDETLRCAVIIPFAARYSEEDMELGGHKIAAGTPVIHAIPAVLTDEKIWPNPSVFDPERFSEKGSKGRPKLAFPPFGFAGRRQCPGNRFAYMQASIMLVTAVQNFKFSLVPGQNVKPLYGFVTRPSEEVWFKVAKRV